jgi:hypothetical protein
MMMPGGVHARHIRRALVRSEDLYGRGPWVVVTAVDDRSEGFVESIMKQCRIRRVAVVERTINGVQALRADRYPVLILLLPSHPSGNVVARLQPFADLLAVYRAGRPDGLDELLEGRCSWHEAGVIQVVGRNAVVRHRVMSSAARLRRVCAVHYTDCANPAVPGIEVFGPFEGRSVPLTHEASVDQTVDEQDDIAGILARLREWGIRPTEVPALRERIDACRLHFENPRYPALYRPVDGIAHNRLGFVLDGIDHRPMTAAARKAWTENGARVTRYVLRQLTELVPALARPRGRAGTRGAQDDLRTLYLMLRTADDLQRLCPPPDDVPT